METERALKLWLLVQYRHGWSPENIPEQGILIQHIRIKKHRYGHGGIIPHLYWINMRIANFRPFTVSALNRSQYLLTSAFVAIGGIGLAPYNGCYIEFYASSLYNLETSQAILMWLDFSGSLTSKILSSSIFQAFNTFSQHEKDSQGTTA
jgi:hypothetical protein